MAGSSRQSIDSGHFSDDRATSAAGYRSPDSFSPGYAQQPLPPLPPGQRGPASWTYESGWASPASSTRTVPLPRLQRKRSGRPTTSAFFAQPVNAWPPNAAVNPPAGAQTYAFQLGYYRLFTPDGPYESLHPIYNNDPSLSSFNIDHVAPPRGQADYEAYICTRENIRPSCIRLVANRRLRKGLQTLQLNVGGDGLSETKPIQVMVYPPRNSPGRTIPVAHDLPTRNLDQDFKKAYYRLFYAGKGQQSPMPSQHPVFHNDASLAQIHIDLVSPPRHARDYITYICRLEDIHPARVTLFIDAATDTRRRSTYGQANNALQAVSDIDTPVNGLTAVQANPFMLKVNISGSTNRSELVYPPKTWVGRVVGRWFGGSRRYDGHDDGQSTAGNTRAESSMASGYDY